MKTLLIPVLLAVSLPAFAEVDPKIHKLCIEAKDYSGCVRSMKGETMPTSRQINSQGADIAEGNQCPSGFAYVGGGNCQEVWCLPKVGRNDYRLAGKYWKCPKGFMGLGRNSLTLRGPLVRASVNNSCPSGEPVIGYESTCQMKRSTSAEIELQRSQDELLLKRKSDFYN